jgi:hypothetical protein
MRLSKKIEENTTFAEPIFTSEKIKEVFTEISTNPLYATNMKKLKY